MIQHAISSVVRDRYGLQWEPRVVLQKKDISKTLLKYVDYAVPCFDIAKILDVPPADITKDIVMLLKNKNRLEPASEYLQNFNFDNEGGYVNFQLDDEYIKTTVLSTNSWLGRPEDFFDAASIDIMALGYGSYDLSQLDDLHSALDCLSRLSSHLNISPSMEYILSDISEESIEGLVDSCIGEADSKIEKISARKTIINALSLAGNSGEHQSYINVRELIKNHAVTPQHKKILEIKNTKILHESNIADEVNGFFNEMHSQKEKMYENFKHDTDEKSHAVYYIYDEDYIPVRSSKGYLHSGAFIFYRISRYLLDAQNGKKVIILAPRRWHEIIGHFVSSLDTQNTELVLFDPKTSRADLGAIQLKLSQSDGFIKEFQSFLSDSYKKMITKQLKRQHVLSLIDFPIDANRYITSMQLPALFDLSNSVFDIISEQA